MINRIVIHHSLTKDSETVSWGAIRRYHTKTLGWSGIGYHWGIELLRDQTEILVGRMPDIKGAHVRGYNADSLGICIVGNFDETPPPLQSWMQAVRLVKWLKKKYPEAEILGHRELDPNKSCPGKLFSMDQFRRDVML